MAQRGIQEQPPDISRLLEKKLVLFGGKGGVGKTSCASAFAYLASSQGKRCLLVSTDPAHSTSDIFERELSGGEPVKVCSGLDVMEIDSEKECQSYIDSVKENIKDIASSQIIYQEAEKQVELARMSPGAEESAIFYRFCRLIGEESLDYDLIIFDMAPTGHSLRLLALPDMMNVWIEGLISRRKKVSLLKRMWENVSQIENSEDKVMRILLERRDHFAKAGKILLNSEMTAFVFVLMAEKLPILETVKGIQQLEALNIPVDGLIINKVLPDHAVGEFYESRKAQESSYIKEIEERFAGKDMWKINMAGSDLRGLDSIRDFAGSFV